MKPIAELNHYEVLEVAPGADRDEIERAWRLARSTYDEASLAVYSVYGEDEARQIRERVDAAWQVLSDAEARRAYDAEHLDEAALQAQTEQAAAPDFPTAGELPLEISLMPEDDAALLPETPPIPAPLAAPAAPAASAGAEAPEPRAPVQAPLPAPPPASELEALEDEGDPTFDGPRLRRSRLHRGLEIEHIARVTKINPTYLRFIEDERFDDLPAPVYVRGFVSAFARCIGLDAERAAGSYMERFQAARIEDAPQRGRRLR